MISGEKNGMARYRWRAALLLCFALAIQFSVTMVYAQTTDKGYDLYIRGGALGKALDALYQQTGVQLIYPHDQAEVRGIHRIRGNYSIAEALTIMLQGTGFSGELTDGGVIVVSKTPEDKRLDLADTQPADNSGENRSMEVIVVTAQKRGFERLQDVPISISVLGGGDLDLSRFEGIADALNQVPGVFQAPAPANGGASYSIRGVTAGSGNFTGASTVGYYMDEVPFGFVKTAFVPDSNVYDMDRVEVLRGPQGTLYGASALNGVIRVMTKSADLDQSSFKMRLGLSSTEQASGGNTRVDAALNLPLVPGKFALRAVLGGSDYGGWIDSSVGEDLNDSQTRNARLKIHALPTERLDIEITGWTSSTDDGGPPTSGDLGVAISTILEPRSDDFDLYSVKAQYDFDRFTLLTTGSYMQYENTEVSDILFGQDRLFTRYRAEFLTQEVRLASIDDDLWQWSLGGLYRQAEDNLFQTLPLIIPAPVDFTYTSDSMAVFGELTRSLYSGAVEVTLGMRYFKDRLESRENTALSGDPKQALALSSAAFDRLSPRVVASWYPHEDLAAYVSYSEGFRSGFAADPVVTAQLPEFPATDEDVLRNYEIGLKGMRYNGRLQYELAAYYMDWRDVQQKINVLVNDVNLIAAINGGAFKGPGVDLNLRALPAAGLEVYINGSWNDLAAENDIVYAGGLLFEQGDQPNQSPEYTLNTGIDYRFPLAGTNLSGKLSMSANYRSDTASRALIDGVSSVQESDKLLTAQLGFSIVSNRGWSSTLYVDNATNEDARVTPNFAQRYTRLRPRTLGVQFEFSY